MTTNVNAKEFVAETPKYLAIGASEAYTIDFTNIGTPSSLNSVKIYNSAGTDVSSTVGSGSASLNAAVVTTQEYTPTAAGLYRIVASVEISGQTKLGILELIVYAVIPSEGTNAYATLYDLKQYLGISGNDDDTLLIALLARAKKYIDDDRGYTFESAADATRKFTVGDDTEGNMLYLDTWLASITSITTNADANSPTTLSATTDYITHPRNTTPYHAIEIKSSSSNSWTYTDDPADGVTISGKWAWATAAPDDIVQANLRLAAYYYRQKDAGVFDTTAIPDAGIIQVPQGVPRDVRLILDGYPKGYNG